MADINLKGMGVALITPFKEDESVDYEALGKLVDYQVQNGTDYLVVLGTTAETPTLTEEEKKNIISLVVTRVRGRIPIVLGVGGNCTRSVVEKLKTDNFEGIDAIISLPKKGFTSITRRSPTLPIYRSYSITYRGVRA